MSVETSKPADLLEGSKSESVHKFLWNWAHSRGISTDMDGDCTTERWLEIICERFKSAAHISEVERVTKERDEISANRDAWKNDAEIAQGRLAPYEACKGLWLQCIGGELLCLNIAEQEQRNRAEAAESKLSQLQLAVGELLAHDGHRDAEDYDAAKLLAAREKLAILNGGQS